MKKYISICKKVCIYVKKVCVIFKTFKFKIDFFNFK